jgi:hypothetical protein
MSAQRYFFVHNGKNSGFSGGVYYRFRDFKPNIVASDLSEGIARITRFVEGYRISEPAAFISGNYQNVIRLVIRRRSKVIGRSNRTNRVCEL